MSMQTFKFVVNGEEVEVDAGPVEPVSEIVARVLVMSKNSARPLEDWELRHQSGVRIPVSALPLAQIHLPERSILYLTLQLGAGGSSALRVQPRPVGHVVTVAPPSS